MFVTHYICLGVLFNFLKNYIGFGSVIRWTIHLKSAKSNMHSEPFWTMEQLKVAFTVKHDPWLLKAVLLCVRTCIVAVGKMPNVKVSRLTSRLLWDLISSQYCSARSTKPALQMLYFYIILLVLRHKCCLCLYLSFWKWKNKHVGQFCRSRTLAFDLLLRCIVWAVHQWKPNPGSLDKVVVTQSTVGSLLKY